MRVDEQKLRQKLRATAALRRSSDKSLFRVPSPFYRTTQGRIVCPAQIEKITFVRMEVEAHVHDSIIMAASIVRGWLVPRANNELFAYHIEENTRIAPEQYAYDTLRQQIVERDSEGSTWARGWDDETFAAMSAALVMA